jgi:AraC-like DNA-binding protein
MICGSFEFEGQQAKSFLTVLPEWIRVRRVERGGNEWLDATMRFLRRETHQGGVGADTIITRLIDVLFVEAVRTWLREQPQGSAGWLGALRDPPIGAALGLIHQAPDKRWTVPSLAAAVGMSRSPFAARFTALVGVSPMAYLKHWRMQVGATLLARHAQALASVAEQVGYESIPAFSRAFTREFGVPPAQYRRIGTLSTSPRGEGSETAKAGPRERPVRRTSARSSSSPGNRRDRATLRHAKGR